MKLHYIYYSPDFIQHDGTVGKIGCTRWLKKRLKEQNITNYEILETHTDEYIAAKREKELQIEKNCVEKFVKIDYSQTVKWSSSSPVNKKGYKKSADHIKNISKAHKGKTISEETKEKLRTWSLGRKRPECSLPGELNPNTNLTNNDVIWIRKHCIISKNRHLILPKGKYKSKEISEMFNIGIAQVRNIMRYKTWKHVK